MLPGWATEVNEALSPTARGSADGGRDRTAIVLGRPVHRSVSCCTTCRQADWKDGAYLPVFIRVDLAKFKMNAVAADKNWAQMRDLVSARFAGGLVPDSSRLLPSVAAVRASAQADLVTHLVTLLMKHTSSADEWLDATGRAMPSLVVASAGPVGRKLQRCETTDSVDLDLPAEPAGASSSAETAGTSEEFFLSAELRREVQSLVEVCAFTSVDNSALTRALAEAEKGGRVEQVRRKSTDSIAQSKLAPRSMPGALVGSLRP